MDSPIRLDRWLWVARFFKTRKLCQEAVIGGKVHQQGERCKPGQSVRLDMHLTIRQGHFDKTIIVTALASKRGNAIVAQTLYQETEESIDARESALQAYQQQKLARVDMPTRPNKKQRRQLRDVFKKGE
jgi:ribosome-associated heat shock protein Hsp15